jgi:hypothetical protein
MIRARRVLAVLGAAAAAACGERSTTGVKTPDTSVTAATVALATPNANDGAIVVTLNGPDVAAVQAADSHYIVFTKLVSAQEARVIVIGNLVAGPLFTVRLGNPHALSAYSGAIQQVATRSDSIVANTGGYQLTVSAPQ